MWIHIIIARHHRGRWKLCGRATGRGRQIAGHRKRGRRTSHRKRWWWCRHDRHSNAAMILLAISMLDCQCYVSTTTTFSLFTWAIPFCFDFGPLYRNLDPSVFEKSSGFVRESESEIPIIFFSWFLCLVVFIRVFQAHPAINVLNLSQSCNLGLFQII